MRAYSLPAAEFRPMSSMNTTPLIDVLLVLLIMFIMTIPAQTHKVGIDLPLGKPGPSTTVERHMLVLTATGALEWNGTRVTDEQLRGRLTALAARNDAALQLAADPAARYERFDRVLAEIKRAGVTRLGFVGNDRYRAF